MTGDSLRGQVGAVVRTVLVTGGCGLAAVGATVVLGQVVGAGTALPAPGGVDPVVAGAVAALTGVSLIGVGLTVRGHASGLLVPEPSLSPDRRRLAIAGALLATPVVVLVDPVGLVLLGLGYQPAVSLAGSPLATLSGALVGVAVVGVAGRRSLAVVARHTGDAVGRWWERRRVARPVTYRGSRPLVAVVGLLLLGLGVFVVASVGPATGVPGPVDPQLVTTGASLAVLGVGLGVGVLAMPGPWQLLFDGAAVSEHRLLLAGSLLVVVATPAGLVLSLLGVGWLAHVATAVGCRLLAVAALLRAGTLARGRWWRGRTRAESGTAPPRDHRNR